MFIKLNQIIKKHINNKQEKEFEQFKKIENSWKKTQTKQMLKNTTIKDFKQGVLIIQTKNTSWRNELSFMKDQVKKN
tara:strand:+ start:778 stop:1008 length:231 start_codon:yes stop_codon:yes gene_type:complete